MTSVEKCHSRIHPDCIPSDAGLLFTQKSIQDSTAWSVRNHSMILPSIPIKSKSILGDFA